MRLSIAGKRALETLKMFSSSSGQLLLLLGLSYFAVASGVANFFSDVNVYFGGGRAKVLNNGNIMSLSLDRQSGAGFQSKSRYLYGKIEMQIKLVSGNSAGTVACFYLHSQDAAWDEIDFEFLGNLSGQPYKVHTNVYTGGKGNREQQFFLWFDPTAAFHTYTILWNPRHIVWYVDGKPIREYKNLQSMGVPYPSSKGMRMFSSLWDAEDWATRGGLVKTDWSKAPFVASFANYNADACLVGASGASSCGSGARQWYSQQLDVATQQEMKLLRSKYMVYNYCTDYQRFPQGFPRECSLIG